MKTKLIVQNTYPVLVWKVTVILASLSLGVIPSIGHAQSHANPYANIVERANRNLDAMAAQRRMHEQAAEQRRNAALAAQQARNISALASQQQLSDAAAACMREVADIQKRNQEQAMARLEQIRIQCEAREEQRMAESMAMNVATPEGFTPPQSPAAATPMAGERYPQTRIGALDESAVAAMNYADLRYAINEVYARHGLVFRDKEIDKRFRSLGWYQPDNSATTAGIESRFSEIEKYNVALLGYYRNLRK